MRHTAWTLSAAFVAATAACQVLPEDANNIKELTVEQAERIVRASEPELNLDGVTELSAEVAAVLASFRGTTIHLNGITELTEKSAAELSDFKGQVLSLNGVKTLSLATAEALSNFAGDQLELNGLKSLSQAATNVLENRQGNTSFPPESERTLEAEDAHRFAQTTDWPSIRAGQSPWRAESVTGLNDLGLLMDKAIARTLGDASHAFNGRSFNGITLGDKYVMPAGDQSLDARCLLPIDVPANIAGARPAFTRVMVDQQDNTVVGIYVFYQVSLAEMSDEIITRFGKTSDTSEHPRPDGGRSLLLKYTFPQAVVWVSGDEGATSVQVLDREYVVRSLRPFANSLLSACRWAKQVVRYSDNFEPGRLPDVPLADLEPVWHSSKQLLLLVDRHGQKVARKRKENGHATAMKWDVAACYAEPDRQAAVVDLPVGSTTGIPLLLMRPTDFVRSSLATNGSSSYLFVDLARVLLEHEFPPVGKVVKVLNAEEYWNPDVTLRVESLDDELDPELTLDDDAIEVRVRSVFREGSPDWVRSYQWTDRKGWIVTLTDSLVFTIYKEGSNPGAP